MGYGVICLELKADDVCYRQMSIDPTGSRDYCPIYVTRVVAALSGVEDQEVIVDLRPDEESYGTDRSVYL